MRCPKCGTNNPSTNSFCARCGKALTKLCAKCKAKNPPTSDFCGKCGAPLTNGAGAVNATSSPPESASGVRIAPEQTATELMKQARAKEIIFGPKDAQEMRAELDASPLIEGERKAVTALFADIKGSKTVMASVARVLFEVVSSFAVVLVAAGLVGGISDSAFRIAGAASVVGLIHALRSERASRNEIPVDVSNGVRGVEGFLEDTAKQMKAAGAEAAMIEITNLTENAPLVLGVVERFAEHHLLYCCALPRGLKDGELWLTRNESLKEAVYSEYRNSNLYEGLNDPKLRSLSTEPTRESLLRGLIVRRRLALRPRV